MTILAVTWAKEHDLIESDTVCYKVRWERGVALEENEPNLVCDTHVPHGRL